MRLRVRDEGEWSGREVTLQAGRSITLGTGQQCDLSLPGAPGVEETHCVIRAVKQGGFGVKDLGGPGGTLVNGRRVQVARLAEGDLLRIGLLTLECLAVGASSAPAGTEEPPLVEPRERHGLPARPIDTERIGSEIGGYLINDYLGRGSMGTVFKATQVSLQRQVALKLMRRELTRSQTFVDRFVSEGRAAARFNHPNVVHVYDVGQEGGLYFLSMELMDRGSLEEQVAQRGALPPEEAVHAIYDAAKGLLYAQEVGVVHRDIKPDNLMRNSQGVTKIADLGLATSGEEEEHQEGPRRIFGTPHFISPEQARGEAVDIRSDIYSLGCTFYRLVTGRTPFQGDSVKEIIRSQLTADPEPPQQVEARVPEEVGRIILKMMAKDPADRYQSAAELITDLETQEPGSRSGLKLALVALVLVVALAAWFIWGGGSTPPPQPGNGSATTPKDTNGNQENRDLLAKAAYLEIQADQSLTPAVRIKRLGAVATRYPKTEYGRQAAGEANRLQKELAAASAREQALATQEQELLAGLKQARERAGRSGNGEALLQAMGKLPHLIDLRGREKVTGALAEARKQAMDLVSASLDKEYRAIVKALEERNPTGLAERIGALEKRLTAPWLPAAARKALDRTWEPRLSALTERLDRLEKQLDTVRNRHARLTFLAGLYRGDDSALAKAGRLDLTGALKQAHALGKQLGPGPWQALLEERIPLFERALRGWETFLQEAAGKPGKPIKLAGASWRISGLDRPAHLKLTLLDGGTEAQVRMLKLDGALLRESPDLLRELLDPARRGLATPEALGDLALLCTLVGTIPVVDQARKALTEIRPNDPASGLDPAPPPYTSPLLDLAGQLAGTGTRLDPQAIRFLTRETEAARLLGKALRAFARNRNLEAQESINRLLTDHRDSIAYGVLGQGRALAAGPGGRKKE